MRLGLLSTKGLATQRTSFGTSLNGRASQRVCSGTLVLEPWATSQARKGGGCGGKYFVLKECNQTQQTQRRLHNHSLCGQEPGNNTNNVKRSPCHLQKNTPYSSVRVMTHGKPKPVWFKACLGLHFGGCYFWRDANRRATPQGEQQHLIVSLPVHTWELAI